MAITRRVINPLTIIWMLRAPAGSRLTNRGRSQTERVRAQLSSTCHNQMAAIFGHHLKPLTGPVLAGSHSVRVGMRHSQFRRKFGCKICFRIDSLGPQRSLELIEKPRLRMGPVFDRLIVPSR